MYTITGNNFTTPAKPTLDDAYISALWYYVDGDMVLTKPDNTTETFNSMDALVTYVEENM